MLFTAPYELEAKVALFRVRSGHFTVSNTVFEKFQFTGGSAVIFTIFATVADLDIKYTKCLFKDIIGKNYGPFIYFPSGTAAMANFSLDSCVFDNFSTSNGVASSPVTVTFNTDADSVGLNNCTFQNAVWNHASYSGAQLNANTNGTAGNYRVYSNLLFANITTNSSAVFFVGYIYYFFYFIFFFFFFV
jgi:hypothetical protein